MISIEMQIALLIMAVTYVMIIWEKVHRTIAAMFGAVMMVAAGIYFGFLTQNEAFNFIDFNTIGLLLGMMIIAGMLSETGFFEAVAVRAAKLSGGNIWKLLVLSSGLTAFLSMFVDNTTAIIMIAPVTITIANMLGINAIPLLLSVSVMSNMGGIATLIGDPPNIMIGSASSLSFTDFLTHMLPIVLVILVMVIFALQLLFRKWLRVDPKNIEKLMNTDERSMIRDWGTMQRTLAVLGFTILMFIMNDYLGIGLQNSSIAIMGGTLALLFNRLSPSQILEKVDWPTLLFFAGLFIVVGGVANTGFLRIVADEIITIAGNDPMLTAVMLLWIAALGSAIIGAIPYTAAMIPVIKHIGEIGTNTNPLWWALVMGVGFGGCSTPIGSTPSMITVGFSERYGQAITFKEWIKKGMPIMMICSLLATAVFVFTRFLY